MAKQIIVDFKVETGPAVREVQDLKKEIQKVNKEAVTGSKGVAKGFTDSSKASNKAEGS